jgi:hypothetical protein
MNEAQSEPFKSEFSKLMLEILTNDGTRMRVGKTSNDELENEMRAGGRFRPGDQSRHRKISFPLPIEPPISCVRPEQHALGAAAAMALLLWATKRKRGGL